MKVVVEQSLKEEVADVSSFLEELTNEERKEFMNFIDGIRFAKRSMQATM